MISRAKTVSAATATLLLVAAYVFHYWKWPGQTSFRSAAYHFSETPVENIVWPHASQIRVALLLLAFVVGAYLVRHRHRLKPSHFYGGGLLLALLPFFAEGPRLEIFFILLAYLPLLLRSWIPKASSQLNIFGMGLGACLLLVLYHASVVPISEFKGTGGLVRLTGGLSSPSVVAPIALMGLVASLQMFSNSSTVYRQSISGVLCALCSYCLLLSFTRSAVLALVIGALVALVKFRTPTTVFAVALSISLACLLFAVRYEKNRGAHPDTFDASANARIGYQKEAVRMLLNNPLGKGRFAFAQAKMVQDAAAFSAIWDTRSYYLNYGVEFGIGWLLFIIVRDLMFCWHAFKHGSLGLVILMPGMLLYKMLDCPLDFSTYFLPASFTFAALSSALLQENSSPNSQFKLTTEVKLLVHNTL